MAIDQSIINFAVYEDSIEYAGMAKATLPDVTFLTQSISGAGIGGKRAAGYGRMAAKQQDSDAFNQ
mgnify:CR=1 FL=1